jgi:hypothetical protein
MGARQMASIATAAPRCTPPPVLCTAHLVRTTVRAMGMVLTAKSSNRYVRVFGTVCNCVLPASRNCAN